MNNKYYKISILLNIIFLITSVIFVYCFKSQISEYFSSNKDNNIKIVMFGDSIIEDANWNELLKRKDLKKRGFRGFTTSHYLWILKDSVLNYKPEICFISGGINDIGAGIPLKRTKENYTKLIDQITSENVILIVQSTLYQENNIKSKIKVDSLNAFLKNYCSLKEVHFLDINKSLSSERGLKPKYSKDGTHLTDTAYSVWAEELKATLDNIIK